jgi:hypothetical protein
MDDSGCQSRSKKARMKTIREFFLPLVIRWNARTSCAWCFERATIRCKEHGIPLCGGPNCTHIHRYFHGKAAREEAPVGSLLKPPPCVFVGVNGWLDYAVQSVAVVVVGILFAWIMVWL